MYWGRAVRPKVNVTRAAGLASGPLQAKLPSPGLWSKHLQTWWHRGFRLPGFFYDFRRSAWDVDVPCCLGGQHRAGWLQRRTYAPGKRRGVSTLEFAFVILTLVPLLLGTGVVGINMICTLQTIQLARDAGHMFARGVDFSQPGNQTILGNIGTTLGLNTTADAGSAVVILSALTYVDANQCIAGGAVDSRGTITGCTNQNKWVFTQRLLIGNSQLRQSKLGTPTGVPIDSNSGKILAADYVTNAGAVATFTGVNPYAMVNGSAVGLPSGQSIFVGEAAATGFSMRPFVPNAVTYSYGLF